MRLRWIALVGIITALIGFFLVFLPIFQNPILWGVPTTAPTPAYVPFGLLLFFVGSIIMLYSLFAFTWRSRNAHPSRGAISMAAYKLTYKPALAGALAFLVVRAATHIIFPNPPSPVKLGPLFDFGTLFQAALVSFSVAFYLIRYYDRLPFANPIIKSVVPSTVALVILAGLSAFAAGNSFYFMVYLLYGVAEFTATGVVVGFVYAKAYGPQSTAALVVSQANQKGIWRYYLPIFAIIGLVSIYGFYQDSLQPVSFKVSDIHFNVTNGSIQVVANVTNTSRVSIIQVDAAIDGVDAGVCGYGINTNQTMNCRFQIIPLPTCPQLPQIGNHTLTLSPYFDNGKYPKNSYSFTTAQLGCA